MKAPDIRPRKTLRPWRAAFFMLLRVAAWTSLALLCALYYINETRFQPAAAPAKAETPAAAEIALPAPPLVPSPAPPPVPADARGSLALVVSKIKSPGGTRAAPKALPRLQPSLGGFKAFKNDFPRSLPAERLNEGGAEMEEPPVRAGGDSDEVVLPVAALKKKVKAGWLKPVPPAAARRYSAVDKEAVKLRAEKQRKAEEAAAAAKKRLLDKAILAVAMFLGSIMVILIGSRILEALRLIEKPEGGHWTLK